MELISYVEPPNRAMSTAFVPAKDPITYKDVLFMDFDETNRLLVGSTNVSASFWEGALQIFHDFEHYQEGKWQSYYNSSIIFDGKCMKNNRQLIAESESKLKILWLPEGLYEPQSVWLDCVEHFDAIKQICLWDDEHKALTATDTHITQWDMSTSKLKSLWDFTDYHTDVITAIDTKRSDNNVFVSVGKDRRTLLWDIRMESPALELYYNEFCSITSVAWCAENNNLMVIGTQAGNVYMLDLQQPKEFVDVHFCYKKGISKLQFDGYKLAVVGDTNEVIVYYCKGGQFRSCYKNSDKHSKFVLDAKWNQETLFTSGLDSQIIKHSFELDI